MDGTANHFPTKNARAGFCIYNLKKIFLGHTPGLPQNRAGAWTQTPISVWLASVPLFLFYQTTRW